MYGPSRSNYGGYGGYWGGYGRPPHPPPPPPVPSHQPPPPFHPPPPPFHFRPVRPPPHALRPPPPPPPIRLPRPQQQQPPYPQPPIQSQQTCQQLYMPQQQERKSPTLNSSRPQSAQAPPNQQNYRSRQSNGSTLHRRSSDTPPYQNMDDEVLPIGMGSPLVPRSKEKDAAPLSPKQLVPNNKRPLPVELDPNLPEELVSKFHNNSCELCDVRLNSRVQAKNHYEGKQHKKKVKNYVDMLGKEGQPPAKVPKLDLSTPKKKSEPLDVSQLYCKCCDLSFTSEQHAQQHYMGRNHQRVLHGLKPLKAGYYNKETGKWQRMPPDPRVSVERIDLNLEPTSDDGTGSSSDKQLDPDGVKERGRFYCEMCSVSATSQEQLDGHLVGQRHMKAVRATAKKASTAVPGPTDSILASVIKADEVKKPKSKDFSIYRTPSGKYYCAPCDLTLNSESQFAQHVESKKHKTRRVK
ncbi:zinc finger matrin-type protein 3-like isoform X2 [Penaeus japonicus]|nr:zinc finger matrin-type protein 3-like isoform X2 [Penaeus japonicus]XP_042876684.1 zinc finger matrin-type protein 3-like isoform X2 [Penaeus japonicus]